MAILEPMIIQCPDCATQYSVDPDAFDDGGRAVRCSHCGGEWYQIGPSESGGAAATPARREPDFDAAGPFAAGAGSAMALDDTRRRAVDTAFRRDVQSHLDRGFGPARRAGFDRSDEVRPSEADRARPGGRSARRAGLGFRAAAFVAIALAVQAPIGLYYLAPQITAAAPASSEALASYRSGVDLAFAWAASSVFGAEARSGVVFIDHGYDLVEQSDGRALLVWGRVANASERDAAPPEIEIVSRDADGKPLQTWRARAEAEMLAPGESARFASRMMFPLEPVRDVDLYFVKP